MSAEIPPSPHGGGRIPAAPIESPTALPPTAADTSVSFCENKLATADPAQYYGVLFVAREMRAALIPLYAFWLEVREIVDECREPEIARVKLDWWHEEVHETAAGRPRHPISVALSPVLDAHPLFAASLAAVIEAVARHTERAAYATYAQLRDYGVRTRGAIEQLAASIMESTDATTMERVAEIGGLLELTSLLRDTGLHARRSRCYLPLEDLARFGVDSYDLYAGRPNDAINQLIKFHARRVREELRLEVARVPAAAQPSLLSAAGSADVLLTKIAAAGGRVLRERLTLLPLRHLWVAWRSARRAARTRG